MEKPKSGSSIFIIVVNGDGTQEGADRLSEEVTSQVMRIMDEISREKAAAKDHESVLQLTPPGESPSGEEPSPLAALLMSPSQPIDSPAGSMYSPVTDSSPVEEELQYTEDRPEATEAASSPRYAHPASGTKRIRESASPNPIRELIKLHKLGELSESPHSSPTPSYTPRTEHSPTCDQRHFEKHPQNTSDAPQCSPSAQSSHTFELQYLQNSSSGSYCSPDTEPSPDSKWELQYLKNRVETEYAEEETQDYDTDRRYLYERIFHEENDQFEYESYTDDYLTPAKVHCVRDEENSSPGEFKKENCLDYDAADMSVGEMLNEMRRKINANQMSGKKTKSPKDINADSSAFECEVCLARFSRKSDCARHARLHNPDAWYHCGMCPRKFARRDSLLRHEGIHQYAAIPGNEHMRRKKKLK